MNIIRKLLWYFHLVDLVWISTASGWLLRIRRRPYGPDDNAGSFNFIGQRYILYHNGTTDFFDHVWRPYKGE